MVDNRISMDVKIHPYVLRAQIAARVATRSSALVAKPLEREDSRPVELPATQSGQRFIGAA